MKDSISLASITLLLAVSNLSATANYVSVESTNSTPPYTGRAAATGDAASARAVERRVLSGHVPEAISRLGLQPVGRLPATNRLRLAIGLPLHNTNELNRLVEEVSDPTSSGYRHYLTPEQFTKRFGPTEAEYAAVKQFASRYGLEVSTPALIALFWM